MKLNSAIRDVSRDGAWRFRLLLRWNRIKVLQHGRDAAFSFVDNPRPKLAGLLPPKTGPRPRDCRDYAAVTHVARVRSIAPVTCKYRYYRVLCRVYASCVKERHRRRHLVDESRRVDLPPKLSREGRRKSSFSSSPSLLVEKELFRFTRNNSVHTRYF